jgi:hypothetical protein
MVDESPEKEPHDKQSEKLTLDREYATKLRNKRPIAASIAIAVVVLAVFTYANNFHDQWEKTLSWFHPAKVPAPFDAQVDMSIQNDYPVFWIVSDEVHSIECPSTAILNMAITNLQTNPTTVSGYAIEALDVNNKWVKLPHIQVLDYQHVYIIEARGSALAVSAETDPPPLDKLLTNHIFEPHIPLRGLVFLNSPLLYSFAYVRVIVRDTSGVQFISGPLKPRRGGIQGSWFRINKDKVIDLSKHRIDYHCGS